MKLIFLCFFFLTQAAYCQNNPSVNDILKSIDDNYKLKKDIKAQVSLTQSKAGQGTKLITLSYFRRDFDDAFLIVMNSPENEKGNGYLRTGDNFFMYRKNTRTFQHINRDESIAGTDAKGDDFETRKLTELYEGEKDSKGKEKLSEEMLGKIKTFRFEIKAKVKDVDYPKQILWTSKDENLLLKQESYSLSGVLMQTAYFLKYTKIEDKYIPVKQIFIDEFEKGNKTIVEISDIVSKKLDDFVFTKAYLENLSK